MAALGPDYQMERELPAGGMSRVFVALDRSLGRRVVVKLVPDEALHSLSLERFRREISVAARLQHPHIVPLLSAGESDSVPYFLMPYIEGDSLRHLLAARTPVPIPDALRMLRELASALSYAHRNGVIHRDIKPDNILLADSHVVVADFGIAKALHAATEGASAGLTSVGMAIGTPAYMSPEQATGDPATDHRTDIYAFGMIAYEMLSGVHPFEGRPPMAMLAAHLTEIPDTVANRRHDVPQALAALVMQCLEKEPLARPATADEIMRALDTMPTSHAPQRPERPSVAVLPLVNTGGDVEDEHFSDGLTDELISALSKVRELSVCGRTSAFALKGKGLDSRTIARTLRVQHLLEGSVRRTGSRLKVRTQLVDTNGNVLWSEGYDRTYTDVFDVQEEIAQAVAQALQVHLSGRTEPLVRQPTSSLAAYELFLRGRALRRRFTPTDIRRAIEYFEQAIALDPQYATAMAWLSDAHVLLAVLLGRPTPLQIETSRRYADQALAIDPQLADGHWALGQWRMCFSYEWPDVEQAYRDALRLDPSHVDARHLYGIALLHQGRFAESLVQLRRALATDPLSAEALGTLSRLLCITGEFEDSITAARSSLELAPGGGFRYAQIGFAYLQLGQIEQAVTAYQHGVAQFPGTREAAALAYAEAVTGNAVRARARIDALITAPDGLAPAYHIAMAYVGLGDHESALEWLDRAVDERDPWVTELRVQTAFAPLHGDPRFHALLRRLKLDG